MIHNLVHATALLVMQLSRCMVLGKVHRQKWLAEHSFMCLIFNEFLLNCFMRYKMMSRPPSGNIVTAL